MNPPPPAVSAGYCGRAAGGGSRKGRKRRWKEGKLVTFEPSELSDGCLFSPPRCFARPSTQSQRVEKKTLGRCADFTWLASYAHLPPPSSSPAISTHWGAVGGGRLRPLLPSPPHLRPLFLGSASSSSRLRSRGAPRRSERPPAAWTAARKWQRAASRRPPPPPPPLPRGRATL